MCVHTRIPLFSMLLFIQQIITMNDSSRRDEITATGGVIIMINWTADVVPITYNT